MKPAKAAAASASSSSSTHHNKFLRIISLPLRALCRVRDFYVDRLIQCTNSNVVGLRGASQAPAMPRSFSRASSTRSRFDDSEDYRELVRAASVTWRNRRLEEEMKMRVPAPPPRSVSVGMGRIDEERPINYFGELEVWKTGDDVMMKDLRYPRSKSHTVVARTNF